MAKPKSKGGRFDPDTKNSYLELIRDRIRKNIEVKTALFEHVGTIAEIAHAIGNGGRAFLFGNGGSAADAQHIAAELSGRFYLERAGLPAEALSVNSSVVTAIGNDYSFDKVFARQLEASGGKNDIAIGISTSGNSKNVIEGLKSARRKGMTTIALAGKTGGEMKKYADLCLCIPSEDVARIQECHILAGHMICEIVEKELFDNKRRP